MKSYNVRVRDEVLALTEFNTLTEAGPDRRLEDRTQHRTTHSSLGYLTPLEFHRAWTEQHHPEPVLP